MSSKIALKRLTASDLTFFRWHFENHPAGNQKAINLNANVFIKEFYPSLPEIVNEMRGSIPVDLYLYGPGLSSVYNIQRKIQKKGSYKNYRLNGEFIADPEIDSERFHPLQPGDFVIFSFDGKLKPKSAMAVFIARANPSDTKIYQFLTSAIGNNSMMPISNNDLEKLISDANPSGDHPVFLLLQEEWMEDAAYGGIDGIKALRAGPSKGKITPEDLGKAKRNAESTGRRGEEFVAAYLDQMKSENKIQNFIWVSDENAIAPYDFEVIYNDGSTVYIDAKSTMGNFVNNIHISFNELLQIREDTPYCIYRVFDIDGNNANLKIAGIPPQFAKDIIDILEKLPNGIKSTGISLNPESLFNWNETQILKIPEDEE